MSSSEMTEQLKKSLRNSPKMNWFCSNAAITTSNAMLKESK